MAATATVLVSRMLVRARFRHIQAFVKIAELGSARRSAEAIGLTQPSVTELIADLEQMLETTLFQRHARGMHPTPVALAMLPLARRLLDTLNDCAETVAAVSHSARSVVRLAAISGAVSGVLARALPEFGRLHPTVLVQLQEADIDQIGALLARDGLDMVVCRAPSVLPEGWHFTPLLEDRFVVVAGPDHPLRDRSPISVDDLRAAVWMSSPVASAPRRAFDRWMEELGIVPQLRLLSTRSPSMLWASLQHDDVVCVVPLSVAAQLLAAGELVALDVHVPLAFEPIGVMVPIEDEGEATLALRTYLHQSRAPSQRPGLEAPTRRARGRP